MFANTPDVKEVSDFFFCQLETFRISKNSEDVPEGAINVVAAASKYGLLFVGIKNGFKVLKLENILDINEEKERKGISENYFSHVVKSHTPVLLALSIDQKTLASCVTTEKGIIAEMYDIAAFADVDRQPTPFLKVDLGKPDVKLRDFIWNPAIEGMYSFCLSDGQLHVHELDGVKFRVIGSQMQCDVTAVCWSPKGKQLVTGRKDGSLMQCKPTLQIVKTVQPPTLDEGKVEVVNVCWIATTLFAVVYMPIDPTGGFPILVVISVPKGAPILYMNYSDVCIGCGTNDDRKYLLHYEPMWGILTCASTDSIEIAVIGESPNFVQWDIKEDGRALLPGKDGATHPIGMGVMYCAQRRIVISETQSYAPMPILFFLTNNGLLVSFHMINIAPGVVTLVRPSTPIDVDEERKAPPDQSTQVATAVATSPMPVVTTAMELPKPVPKSQPIAFVTTQIPTTNQVTNLTLSFGHSYSPPTTVFSTMTPPNRDLLSLFRQPPENQNTTAPSRVVCPPHTPVSSTNTFYGLNAAMQPIQPNLIFQPPAVVSVAETTTPTKIVASQEGATSMRPTPVDRSIFTNRVTTQPLKVNVAPQVPQEATQVTTPTIEKPMDAHIQNTYTTAILEEMQLFEKDLRDLKSLMSQTSTIGTKEEIAKLKTTMLLQQDFQKDMAQKMIDLNNNTHTQKNVLLECFTMIEAARSLERRQNDSTYISLLKERALDPVTAKKMERINQQFEYVTMQAKEVNDKLDQDWAEFLSTKNKGRSMLQQIPTTEAIYKTIVNNQKIIHHLRNNIDNLTKRADEIRLQNIYKRSSKAHYKKKSDDVELSKLADVLLQAKNPSPPEEKPQSTRKIPLEDQAVLSEFLSKMTIETVKPAPLQSPMHSRLLLKSAFLMEEEEAGKAKQESGDNSNSNIEIQQPVSQNSAQISVSSENIHVNKASDLPHPNHPVLTETVTTLPVVPTEKPKVVTPPPPPPPPFVQPVAPVIATQEVVSSSPIPGFEYEDITPPETPSNFLQPQTYESDTSSIQRMQESSVFEVVSLKDGKAVIQTIPVSTLLQRDELERMAKLASQNSAEVVHTPTLKTSTPVTFQTKSDAESKPAVASTDVAKPIPTKSPLAEKKENILQNALKSAATSFFSTTTTATSAQSSLITNEATTTKPVPFFSFGATTTTTPHFFSFGMPSAAKSTPATTSFAFGLTATTTTTTAVNTVPMATTAVTTVPMATTAVTTVPIATTVPMTTTTTTTITTTMATSIPIAPTTSVATSASSEIPSTTFSFTPVVSKIENSSTESSISSSTTSVDGKDTDKVTSGAVSTPETSELKPDHPAETEKAVATTATTTPTTVTTTTAPVQPPQTTPAIFGSATTIPNFGTTATTTPPIFGQDVSTAAPIFGQTTATPVFGGVTTATPAFGSTTDKPFFSGSNSSPFAKTTADVPAFGQPVQSSPFGTAQNTTTSPFGTGANTFFSQQPTTGGFGSPGSSVFGSQQQQSSGFSFGKTTFGQGTGSFGLAKAVFGESNTSTPAFGQSPNTGSSTFGQSGSSVFGQSQSGFSFSGLGGKPNPENASKNVFGVSNLGKSNVDNGMFGGDGGASTFGAKTGSFTGGSFSSGGGSVAQAGFAAFQQTPQKTGGFGTSPSFGGAPTFGTSPSFGSPPGFGGSPQLGGSVFGSPQSSNFSNFAAASSPTFGSLASQTAPGFGQQQPQQQQASTFGSGPVFGGSPFGGQQSGFGTGSPQSNSSAFTQWRN